MSNDSDFEDIAAMITNPKLEKEIEEKTKIIAKLEIQLKNINEIVQVMKLRMQHLVNEVKANEAIIGKVTSDELRLGKKLLEKEDEVRAVKNQLLQTEKYYKELMEKQVSDKLHLQQLMKDLGMKLSHEIQSNLENIQKLKELTENREIVQKRQQQLVQKVMELKEMIEKLKYENQQLNQSIEQLRNNEMDLTQAKNMLTNELTCVQARINSLLKEEQALVKTIESLTEDNQKLKMKIAEQTKIIEVQRAEVQGLNTTLGTVNEQNKTWKTMCQQTYSERDKARLLISELQKKLSQAQARQNDMALISQKSFQIQARYSQLQNRYSQLQRKQIETKKRHQTLQADMGSQIQAFQRQRIWLFKTNKDLQTEIQVKQSQLSQYRNKVQNLHSIIEDEERQHIEQYQALENKYKGLQQDHKMLRAQYDTMKRQVQCKGQKEEELLRKCTELEGLGQKERQGYEEKVSMLVSRLEQKDQIITELKADNEMQRAQMQKEMDHMFDKLQILITENQSLMKVITRSEQDVMSLNQQLSAANQSLNNKTELIPATQTAQTLTQVQQLNKVLESQVASLTKQIQDLHQSHDRICSQLSSLTTEYNDLQHKHHKNASELQKLKEDREQLKKSRARVISEYESVIDENRQKSKVKDNDKIDHNDGRQVQKLRKKLQANQQELYESYESFHNKETELEKVNQENHSLTQEIKSLTTQIQSFTDLTQTFQAQITKLNQALTSSKAQQQQLHKIILQIQEKNQQLCFSQQKLKTQSLDSEKNFELLMKEKDQQLTAYKQQIDRLAQQIHHSQQYIAKLKQMIEKLTEEIHHKNKQIKEVKFKDQDLQKGIIEQLKLFVKQVEENSLKLGKTLKMKPKDIKEMEKQTKDDLFNEIMRILVEEHHNKKGFKEK